MTKLRGRIRRVIFTRLLETKVMSAHQSAATKVGSSKSVAQNLLGQSSPPEPTEPLATNHAKVEYA